MSLQVVVDSIFIDGVPLMTASRRGWKTGPWDNEPDNALWTAFGIPCMAKRAWSGAWEGFISLPHPPQHGCEAYMHDERCSEYMLDKFWFGFRCSDDDDYTPAFSVPHSVGSSHRPALPAQNYRALEYVIACCSAMAFVEATAQDPNVAAAVQTVVEACEPRVALDIIYMHITDGEPIEYVRHDRNGRLILHTNE